MGTDPLRDRDWLLLPGTLCSVDVFAGFLDALGVPDARRHGMELSLPEVGDYAPSLARAAAGRIVCGFSLGAIVAAHLADRIAPARIILFGINPFADDPAKAEGRLALERDVMAQGGAQALQSRLTAFAGPTPDHARALALDMADQTRDHIAAQTRLALTRPGALPALSGCRCPVLALTGSQDTSAPPAQGMAAAEAAPYGRFHLLPGSGHYALIEDPAACARAVLQMEKTVP